jgi:hypothetical protein
MKRFFVAMAALFFIAAVSLFAVTWSELRIIADDGTFLGTLNENAYDSNSIYYPKNAKFAYNFPPISR